MLQYDLVATCWTSAGAAAPCTDDERSPVPIRDRVEAVARAGFTGFGIQHHDLLEVKNTIGYTALRSLFDDNGITIVELEFLDDWFEVGAARAVSDRWRRELLEAAEELGARHIKTGGQFHASDFNAERLAPHLVELARDAAEAGTLIAIEPAPFRDVQTPAQALELVEVAGHPAAGVFIDIWHTERMNVDLASLGDIPLDRLFGVELDDGDSEVIGTMLEDTIDRRRFPGEGDFDVAGFVAAIKGLGYEGPWGVEMISAETRILSVERATRRAFDSTMPFLDPEHAPTSDLAAHSG